MFEFRGRVPVKSSELPTFEFLSRESPEFGRHLPWRLRSSAREDCHQPRESLVSSFQRLIVIIVILTIKEIITIIMKIGFLSFLGP